MIVTQIVEMSKTRSKIYIDQEFAFVLYKGELRLYHICEGQEIAWEDYRTIMEEVLPKRAKLRAMNLLKSREYTVMQLRTKLEQGGYPLAVVEEALAYVESFHYIDDLRYAVSFITYNEENKSRRRIEQDLKAKGISGEVMERAWQKWEKEGGSRNELLMIQKLLEKRHYAGEQADYKEQQRTYAFLMRKGFSGEMIRKAMNGVDIGYE